MNSTIALIIIILILTLYTDIAYSSIGNGPFYNNINKDESKMMTHAPINQPDRNSNNIDLQQTPNNILTKEFYAPNNNNNNNNNIPNKSTSTPQPKSDTSFTSQIRTTYPPLDDIETQRPAQSLQKQQEKQLQLQSQQSQQQDRYTPQPNNLISNNHASSPNNIKSPNSNTFVAPTTKSVYTKTFSKDEDKVPSQMPFTLPTRTTQPPIKTSAPSDIDSRPSVTREPDNKKLQPAKPINEFKNDAPTSTPSTPSPLPSTFPTAPYSTPASSIASNTLKPNDQVTQSPAIIPPKTNSPITQTPINTSSSKPTESPLQTSTPTPIKSTSSPLNNNNTPLPQRPSQSPSTSR